MLDVVHIDEKWFCLSEELNSFYLEIDEPEPNRQVKL